jgi:hypothetical protein
MDADGSRLIDRRRQVLVLVVAVMLTGGCAGRLLSPYNPVSEAVIPTDVKLLRYHLEEHGRELKEFTRRLYAKNPCYEPDPLRRRQKVEAIAADAPPPPGCPADLPSHELLRRAFSADPRCNDRVWLLCRGLKRSIAEAYGADEGPLVSSMEVPPGRLERLYHNISQVNWRLKTYCTDDGRPIFRTNEAGEDGYINMGYEVIMTRMLTRIADDIYLRGGSPPKFFFNVSTMFLAILL